MTKELDRAHPHWRLTSLLKDADGLDRVRLGDLDAQYLRNPQAREMVGFAEALFNATNGRIAVGPDHFAALWPEAARMGRTTADMHTLAVVLIPHYVVHAALRPIEARG